MKKLFIILLPIILLPLLVRVPFDFTEEGKHIASAKSISWQCIGKNIIDFSYNKNDRFGESVAGSGGLFSRVGQMAIVKALS